MAKFTHNLSVFVVPQIKYKIQHAASGTLCARFQNFLLNICVCDMTRSCVCGMTHDKIILTRVHDSRISCYIHLCVRLFHVCAWWLIDVCVGWLIHMHFVIFRKRATNYKTLLRKMTYKDKHFDLCAQLKNFLWHSCVCEMIRSCVWVMTR